MNKFTKYILWANSMNTLITDILGLVAMAGIILLNHQVSSPMSSWLVVLAWVCLPMFAVALVVRYRNRRAT